jgi:hypothetical protein
MRSFSLAEFFKDAEIIEMPRIDAMTQAEEKMDKLFEAIGQDGRIEGQDMPDLIKFTPFAGNKAYIIRPEDILTAGTSYLDLHNEYAAYLMAGGCNQVEEIEPANGKELKLAQVYSVTGNPIDIVYELKGLEGHIMLVNDEGWLEAEPQHNMMASLISGRPIAGTVIICPERMFQ